ncbi:MAG: polysaccharide deacetylase family protein [Bacteroidota bacterium]
MQLSIFLFHRVSPTRDPLWDPIDPKRFEEQLRMLKRRFHLVSLETYLSQGEPVKSSKPLASVVFDDGYRDFAEYALPILRKHQVPSSLYVVTDCVDQQQIIWTYQLDYLFAHTQKMKLELRNQALGWKTIRFKNQGERLAFAKSLKPVLKKVHNGAREDICQQVAGQFNDVQLPERLYLNWEELRSLQKEQVTIGSHTRTHAMLGNIREEERIVDELLHSARRIETELGDFPATISYPIGSYSSKVKTLSQKLGYQFGLAVDQKKYKTKLHDTFAIPRIELYHEGMLKSWMRATGMWEALRAYSNIVSK